MTTNPSIGQQTTQHNEQLDELGSALAGVLANEAPAPTAIPVKEEIPDDDGLLAESGLLPEEEEVEEVDEETIDDGPLPAGVKARAEALEVDPSFFYEMEYTLNDGTVMTVGDMKDQIQSGGGAIQAQQQELQAKVQQFEAQQALQEQYGAPIMQLENALQEVTERYKQTNWKELTDEHGDKAELAKLQMQQRYSEIENRLNTLKGEHQQAMQSYSQQATQGNIDGILKAHPTWTDPQVAQAELGQIHEGVKDIISIEEMTHLIGQMGPKALQVFERAATGGKVANIDTKRVKRAAKALKGGKSISAKQQRRMQQAKRNKAAVGGTRQQREAAAVQMIADAGGI